MQSVRSPRTWVAAALVVAVASACTATERTDSPASATLPTVTVPTASVADELAPDAAEIVAALRAASSEGTVCSVLAVAAGPQPAVADSAQAIEVYTELGDALGGVASSVPEELREPWSALAAGVDDALSALIAAEGDVADPEFRAAFRRTSTVEAVERLEQFQRRSCTGS